MPQPVSPSVSIVIPAFNEAEAILSGKLRLVMDWCEAQTFKCELLVVDDGSEDETAALAREVLKETTRGRVMTIDHAGKAAAVIAGIRSADSPIVLFTDMDQATPIKHAGGLMKAIEGGADIAIGSRGYTRAGAPLHRKVMSMGQVILRSLLLGLTLPDTQCGFKAFRKDAVLEALGQMKLYHPRKMGPRRGPSVTSGFDVELLFVSSRLGYKIEVVPVDWHYEITRRVNLRHDALRGVRDLVSIAAARWRGAYPSKQRSSNILVEPDTP